MSVVTKVVMLLLLAALRTSAASDSKDCGNLNKTLSAKDLNKIVGDWVLTWAVAANSPHPDVLGNLSSSYVEFRLHPDNSTISFKEENQFPNKTCIIYHMNLTVPSDPDQHSVHMGDGTLVTDGVVSQLNHSADLEFFETCPDCLRINYRGALGQWLLTYRREGHHQDVEQQKASHSDLNKLSECLGIPHDKPFIYDGAAGFCHKESSPEATTEQS